MNAGEIEILCEEGPLLAVNKPPGLLTQAPPGIDSLELRIKRFLKVRENKPGNVYLGVPHRLDRPVSGVIVFAKHVRAAQRISGQFERREVGKKYWALVAGCVSPAAGTWRDHLCKLENEPRGLVCDEHDPEGRLAVLHYRVLQQFESAVSWLEIELETGRMHQIRIQAASRGHPLLGDELYGSSLPFGPVVTDVRERLIALHARSISLRHPMTDLPLQIAAPLTSWWNLPGLNIADTGPGEPAAPA